MKSLSVCPKCNENSCSRKVVTPKAVTASASEPYILEYCINKGCKYQTTWKIKK